MAKSLLIQVEPEILKYARKYSGLSLETASKKAKINIEKLQSLEDQKQDISITRVEKLTKVYKRPLAFFLLSTVPEDAVEPKDFRIVFSEKNEFNFSPSEYLAIRRSRYVQSVIAELADYKFDYSLPSALIGGDPEKISNELRGYLGVSMEEQTKWSSPAVALQKWKSILEEKDIFVLQNSLPKEDMSAFCLVDKEPYVIVLNYAEHPYRRIFSLFHEIGHLLLHKSGICTPDDLSKNSYQYVQIEKFCNQIAASFLLPQEDFLQNPAVLGLKKNESVYWTDEDLMAVAATFKVSKEVVLRRFLTLGDIDELEYKTRREEWLAKEKLYLRPKNKKVIIPQYQQCLSRNGRGFTSFILAKYHSNRITFSAAADFLNIGAKQIARLESKL